MYEKQNRGNKKKEMVASSLSSRAYGSTSSLSEPGGKQYHGSLRPVRPSTIRRAKGKCQQDIHIGRGRDAERGLHQKCIIYRHKQTTLVNQLVAIIYLIRHNLVCPIYRATNQVSKSSSFFSILTHRCQEIEVGYHISLAGNDTPVALSKQWYYKEVRMNQFKPSLSFLQALFFMGGFTFILTALAWVHEILSKRRR